MRSLDAKSLDSIKESALRMSASYYIFTFGNRVYCIDNTGKFVDSSSTTDSSGVFNTAIDEATTAGGAKVLVRYDSYNIGSNGILPKSNVWLCGESVNTKLLATSTLATAIVDNFGTEASPITDFRISNFEIDGTGFPAGYNTGKKGINGEHFIRSRFDHCYVHNTPATGIGIDLLEECMIDHNWVVDCGTLGQLVGSNGIGVATGGRIKESSIISNNVTKNTGNIGIFYEESEDVINTGPERMYIIANNISINDKYGIGAQGCKNVIVNSNTVYHSGFYGIIGWDFTDNVDVLSNFVVTNNYVSNAQSFGIFIDEHTNGFTVSNNIVKDGATEGIVCRGQYGNFDNNVVHDNGSSGFFIGAIAGGSAMSNISITNNKVYNNGKLLASKDGIRIDATSFALSHLNVQHNRCFDDQGTQTQRYGILLTGNQATSYIRISNNDVVGNLTGGLFDNAGAKTNVIKEDNFGYNPVGPASITVGASPYTYTSGNSREVVYIRGGTVSSVAIGGRTQFVATGCTVMLPANTAVVVTYSVLPTMEKYIM